MVAMRPSCETIRQEIEKVEAYTRERHATVIALFQDAIALYIEAFDLTKPQDKSPARVLQHSFLSQALNTILLASDSMTRGFYFQTIGMARFLMECWATYWYLDAHPNEAERWFINKANKRPPKVDTMLQRMNHPTPHTKAKAFSYRSTLNRFAHSDSAAISHLIQQEGGDTIVRWGVTYDEGKFHASSIALIVWTGNLLDAISRSVPHEQEWHERHNALAQVLVNHIDALQQRILSEQQG